MAKDKHGNIIYESGLAARFKNAGKEGYTLTGGIDWDYRGGNGPVVNPAGAEDWSAEDWQAFGRLGGTIDNNGQLVWPKQTTSPGWMGKGGYLDTGASVVGALSGLANAYTGYKGLQLAEDEFEFNKALSQTNLANQAKLINEQRLNAGNVGLALAGNTMSEADRTATRNKITAGNVAGKI